MTSQRVETIILKWLNIDWVQDLLNEWELKERGAHLRLSEYIVIVYVFSEFQTIHSCIFSTRNISGLIFAELKSLWSNGVREYLSDLWNIADFITHMFFVTWVALKLSSICLVWVSTFNKNY